MLVRMEYLIGGVFGFATGFWFTMFWRMLSQDAEEQEYPQDLIVIRYHRDENDEITWTEHRIREVGTH